MDKAGFFRSACCVLMMLILLGCSGRTPNRGVQAREAEILAVRALRAERQNFRPENFRVSVTPRETSWQVSFHYVGDGFFPHSPIVTRVIKGTGDVIFEDIDVSDGTVSKAAAEAIAREHISRVDPKSTNVEWRTSVARIRSFWMFRFHPPGEQHDILHYVFVSAEDGHVAENEEYMPEFRRMNP